MKCLIAGAGGIGSYMGHDLFDLEQNNQLKGLQIVYADDDTVEEKNVKYQNFDQVEITDYKVEVMSNRYGFVGLTKRIENAEELLGYDLIVSAVDNPDFRELLFRTDETHNKFFWIDLRSEGRSIALFTKNKKNPLEKMLGTLPEERGKEGGSCQLQYEFENDIIQLGNRIIARIGIQQILNWLRGDNVIHEFIQQF